MLPLLVVLFMLSYGLMTLLIVEQGSTILSQRALIHDLLGDTQQLAAMKGKQIREQALSRQAQAKNDSQTSTAKAPTTEAPSAQAPLNETPSTQAKPQSNRGGKLQRPVPTKPASDMADVRRNLMSI